MFYMNFNRKTNKQLDISKYMKYEFDTYDILNSYFLAQIKKLKVAGEYLIQSDEKKPDLISHRIYGDTQYWWVLMIYNSYYDTQDIVTGKTLQYPSIPDMNSVISSLRSQQVKNS